MKTESKELKDLGSAIALHEQALADVQAKLANAIQAQTAFREQELSEQRRFMRPGQAAVSLPVSAERERLETERLQLSAEALRLDKKLGWLRGLLKDLEQRSQ